jgi:hypothetical protein
MILRFCRWWFFSLLVSVALAEAAELRLEETKTGLSVSLDPATGAYAVRYGPAGWRFAGSVGSAVSDATTGSGQDQIGGYRALQFRTTAGEGFTATIRLYSEQALMLFTATTERASVHGLPAFPAFADYPANLGQYSFENDNFAPPKFALVETSTPWLLFDGTRHAVVISPADNFLVAKLSRQGGLASGLNPEVTALPAGFTHGTLLAFGQGIHATWTTWGQGLQRHVGRPAVANDVDVGLRYLGYWTDNGAFYYYNYDKSLGYAATLLKLVQRYREEKIPIRYLQLDSWWYFKSLTDPDGKEGHPKVAGLPLQEWNRYGGMMKYEAHPGLFPQGLAKFREQVGLPLITHNRWVDPKSPYREHYKFVGITGVDPAWWQHIMDYLASSGVVCYEQDWLDRMEKYSPELKGDPASWMGFLGGMANAARKDGLSIQYCMPEPRHYLQGAAFPSVTTVRTSGDRLDREKWDWFIYTSQLASALGEWPWTDVFMSTEPDNLTIAALSGGMIGTGDEIGKENRENLLRVARPDGVLVKADNPLVPIDAVYAADAAGRPAPMVAAAHTEHAARRTLYIFAYERSGVTDGANFVPEQLGLHGEVLVYDVNRQATRRGPASAPVPVPLSKAGSTLLIAVPVEPSGLALIGDAGKTVADGRKRLAAIERDRAALKVVVSFAPDEGPIRLFGFAKQAPHVQARRGSVGKVAFDPATGRFEFPVSAAPAVLKEPPAGDPIQQAEIEIE